MRKDSVTLGFDAYHCCCSCAAPTTATTARLAQHTAQQALLIHQLVQHIAQQVLLIARLHQLIALLALLIGKHKRIDLCWLHILIMRTECCLSLQLNFCHQCH
jgi:hypothetical protein